jgi:NADPH-dependent curcumin reductase CurA
MAGRRNTQVVLSSRPIGIPEAHHFELVETPISAPGEGEVTIRNLYLSVDPAMRGWVNAAFNYSDPVGIGEVMRSVAVGEITDSNHPDYAPGEIVCGMFGWQEFAVTDGQAIWFKHDSTEAPVTTALGVLGLNGLTAYFGLLDIGRPADGDTVVVSTAAGAVGSAVGQIAKIQGCRAVGITGSDDKVALCRDVFGYDEAINYRSPGLGAALTDACPAGVDVYYDNTAGPISDALYPRLNVGARCVVCGTASIASWDTWPDGPRVERHLLVKRASMQGFVIFDFVDRYPQARSQLATWVREGRLAYREEVLEGLDKAPGAIARLYAGDNLGKLMIRL